MEATPIQVDNVTSLPADDFNPIPREIENGILAAGIVLAADENQLAKSMAVHTGGADYFDCTNTVDAYELSAIAPFKQPPAYNVGMRIRFKASVTNTTTAATIKLGALVATLINIGQLANGGTASVAIGDIGENQIYEAVYDETPDGLTNYWRLLNIVTEYDNGNSSKTSSIESERFTDVGGTYTDIQSGVGSSGIGLRHINAESGRQTLIGGDGAGVIGPVGAAYTPSILNTGKGLKYLSGPGTITAEWRPGVFDASALVWGAAGAGWSSTTGLVLTGIPFATGTLRILGATLRWRNTSTNVHHIHPLILRLNDSAGTTNIQVAATSEGFQPDAANTTGQQITIQYDATDVD